MAGVKAGCHGEDLWEFVYFQNHDQLCIPVRAKACLLHGRLLVHHAREFDPMYVCTSAVMNVLHELVYHKFRVSRKIPRSGSHLSNAAPDTGASMDNSSCGPSRKQGLMSFL